MELKYVLVLISAVLLFGCAMQVQDEQETGNLQNESTANQTIPEGQDSDTEDGTSISESPEPEPEGVPATNTYSADFASLTKMDIPLECEIVYSYQGKEIKTHIFMQGVSRLRVESPAGMSQCTTTITVIRGEGQYVGCEGKMVMPSCDWFRSSYDPSEPGRASNFDFQSVPSSKISCKDWTFDESKFKTEGMSCQLG